MREAQITARLAPCVAEPILASCAAQSGGALRGLRPENGAFGLAGMLASWAVRKGREKTGSPTADFPANVFLILTQTELLAFSQGRRRSQPLARYPRNAVQIRPGRILYPVTIQAAGRKTEFRALKRTGADSLYRNLTAMTSSL
jgi:hypothetical protein